VSSILDALQELETGAPPDAEEMPGAAEQPLAAWKAAALLAVAVALGTGGALLLVSGGLPEPVEHDAAPRATEVAAVLPPAAPAPPLPAALRESDPPRARVTAMETSGPVDAPPRPARSLASARTPRARALPRPRGEPAVQVRSLSYSAVPEERAVALSVGGGGPVTLREGESARGVQVQLILPDGAYVRHGGQIFAVHAY
jgi:hypothetical protein